MSSPFGKNISLDKFCKSELKEATSFPRRGVGRRHRTLEWAAVDADGAETKRRLRTAKTCGPGAAMLALNLA
jgi:hypothetical protein